MTSPAKKIRARFVSVFGSGLLVQHLSAHSSIRSTRKKIKRNKELVFQKSCSNFSPPLNPEIKSEEYSFTGCDIVTQW